MNLPDVFTVRDLLKTFPPPWTWNGEGVYASNGWLVMRSERKGQAIAELANFHSNFMNPKQIAALETIIDAARLGYPHRHDRQAQVNEAIEEIEAMLEGEEE